MCNRSDSFSLSVDAQPMQLTENNPLPTTGISCDDVVQSGRLLFSLQLGLGRTAACELRVWIL